MFSFRKESCLGSSKFCDNSTYLLASSLFSHLLNVQVFRQNHFNSKNSRKVIGLVFFYNLFPTYFKIIRILQMSIHAILRPYTMLLIFSNNSCREVSGLLVNKCSLAFSILIQSFRTLEKRLFTRAICSFKWILGFSRNSLPSTFDLISVSMPSFDSSECLYEKFYNYL